MIFQDPINSLNPRKRVGQMLDHAFRLRGIADAADRRRRILALAERVGLADYHLERFPHELSGGQCQRVGIARALAMEPKLVVCDEPVSALDVSVQAQVLNLLIELHESLGLSYLFISHDLSVVRFLSTRIAVMYLGRFVEIGEAESVWSNHLHPYTSALLGAGDVRSAEAAGVKITGEPPSPVSPPSGCAFRTRCPLAKPICSEQAPALRRLLPGHEVACHFADAAKGGGLSRLKEPSHA